MGRLTKKQAKEIIGYLESGRELPDDYKYVLFPPERREYELVYEGKEREEDIIANTWGVPLQKVKTFGLGKGGHPVSSDWTNRLIFGDNLQVMKRLLDDPMVRAKVRLIYIDPPFATRQDFQGSQDEKAYQDKIVGAQFIEFMRKRLLLMRELLAPNGFLVVHIDYRYSHYLKVVLDELLPGNFRNEIKVPRGTKNVQNQFESISALTTGDDSLLLYSRSKSTRFPHLRIELDETAAGKWDTFWRGTDRPSMRYTLFGQKPTTGQWRWKKYRAYEAKANYEEYLTNFSQDESLDEYYLRILDEGRDLDFVRLNDENVVQYYVPPRDSRVANTIWSDVRTLGKVTSYPTEKHEALLNRLISWLTSQDDLVLDAFAGSGTTIAVAEKLHRNWIGVDCGKLAIYTMQKRLLNLHEEIGDKGDPLIARPFTLFNAGLYDFKRMSALPWDDYRLFALQLFQVRDEPHSLAGIALDGFKGDADVLVFDFQHHDGVVLDEDFIAELHKHLGSRVRREFYIIAPASRVTFLEDYIDHDLTRYYTLRIPYSIIDELHDRPFQEIQQPADESEINNTVEAVGFDFIVPPTVRATYSMREQDGELFRSATVALKTFRSQAMTKRPRKYDNFETLSMVMVDYDYKGNGEDAFDLDVAFYREEIQQNGWKIHLDPERLGSFVMIIYMDIFGNELREVKTPDDFGTDPSPKTTKRRESSKQKVMTKSARNEKTRSVARPKRKRRGSKRGQC